MIHTTSLSASAETFVGPPADDQEDEGGDDGRENGDDGDEVKMKTGVNFMEQSKIWFSENFLISFLT